MAAKTIPLISPITTHEGQVTEIVLREPKAKDFFEFGEPFVRQRTAEGGDADVIEIPGVLGSYVERCMTKPGPEFLAQVGLTDALRLRDAVMGFFGAALRAAYPSAATSSSSTSASSPPSSAEN